MKIDKPKVLDLIRRKASRPMKLRELASALGVTSNQHRAFRTIVKELIDEAELVKLRRGRIGLAAELDVAVGKLQITRSATGFLLTPKDKEDVMIASWHLGTALDGDEVMVRLGGKPAGRQTGTVIKVIKRSGRNIIGTFREQGNLPRVVPDNPRIHRDLYIRPDKTLHAHDGEKVVAKLDVWDDPHRNPEGVITERLGFPGEPGVDMLTVIRSFGLPDKFPPEVIEAAEDVAVMPEGSATKGRVDLTGQGIYTIDPRDAKDHDDAIHVTKTRDGYKLGVHIADVAHFVKEGTVLDKCALERGNSVYLPGMVIPMLPEILSADVCSLKPNRRRLAHSVEIDFDKTGTMLQWRVFDSIIRSRAKLSYEEVQEYFDTGSGTKGVERVGKNLTVARELALLLNQRRVNAGSLDFDLPEAKIILNEEGEVAELGHRVRMESHRLVEEFMLAANRAIALELFRSGLQLLYRVHDKPDLEKLEHFAEMMARLGYKIPVSPATHPRELANFLNSVSGTPEEELINELLLRSMKKAVYQRENVGHFGLAFKHYTHFTSPIRRYPDLLIHRLLRAREGGRYPPAFARRLNGIIDRVGKHCSETERVAESAEREAVRVKQVAFMAKHIGKEYHGVISGVIQSGLFVRLDNIFVEGMVRISSIDDDYYRFHPEGHRFVGSRSLRVFRLGQRVRVCVNRVNIERREIDLRLLDEDSVKPTEARVRTGDGKKRKTGKTAGSDSGKGKNKFPRRRKHRRK